VRSLRPDKALQLPSASLGFIGAAPPDFAPPLGGSAVRVPIPLGVYRGVSIILIESRAKRKLCPGPNLNDAGQKSASRRSPLISFQARFWTVRRMLKGFRITSA